jgi:type IV secretion system protein VirB2
MASNALACPSFSKSAAIGLSAVLLLAALMLVPQQAHAAVGGGGGLPYEDWLTQLRASLTGPIAFTFSLFGIVGAGATLIFAREINGFLQSIVYLVLVMAFLVAAQNILAGLFGRGAEISLPDVPDYIVRD